MKILCEEEGAGAEEEEAPRSGSGVVSVILVWRFFEVFMWRLICGRRLKVGVSERLGCMQLGGG